MANAILYTRPNCGRCNVIKLKLTQAHIEFSIVDDVDEVNAIVDKSGISSAPILQINDEYLDFSKILNFIKETTR